MSTSPEVLTRPAELRRDDARPAPWLAPGPSSPEGGRPAGYAAGYAAGWAQGAAAAAERAQAVLDAETARRAEEEARQRASAQLALTAVLRAAADLEARDAPALAQLTDALARTGLELATAVVGAEVRTGAGARAALLRALAPCPPTGRVSVHLHPADLVEVRRAGEVPAGVELVADPSLGRGDALAEHPGGSVDARLEQALERAADALLGGGA
ncbi:FliH/SctL family protein [uncultured Pseudokineococcus sp.]|uniref:FliH/SctL family protein n=1 Tax=uncultured Pseudokineococcus sp. TaxID=1642928 RepID=UPI0026153E60|nr:FliH/SctL family protein [uncultured Pseudokineococcus sp.]